MEWLCESSWKVLDNPELLGTEDQMEVQFHGTIWSSSLLLFMRRESIIQEATWGGGMKCSHSCTGWHHNSDQTAIGISAPLIPFSCRILASYPHIFAPRCVYNWGINPTRFTGAQFADGISHFLPPFRNKLICNEESLVWLNIKGYTKLVSPFPEIGIMASPWSLRLNPRASDSWDTMA